MFIREMESFCSDIARKKILIEITLQGWKEFKNHVRKFVAELWQICRKMGKFFLFF